MDLVKFGEDLAVEFADVKSALKTIVDTFSVLQINGPDDADGYTKAREVIKDAGIIRRNIEAKRKSLKEESVEIGRLIDGYARDLQSAINPLEERLKTSVKAIDDHIEMEKAKKKRLAELPARKKSLEQFEHILTDDQILEMTELQFANHLADLSRVKLEQQQAENNRLKAEAAEREREAAEKDRIEAAREEERQRVAQETINREAQREAEAAAAKAREMEENIWPIREKKIRAIFEAAEFDNIENRIRPLKAMVVKMNEAEFEKYIADAQASADAQLAQKKAAMGDREKLADWLTVLLAVPRPQLSPNSIYLSDVNRILEAIREAVNVN